ncbi:MAG: NADH-quinone oxidoreductase subunit A [Pirellulales bacterium]|nr:NADH-quinone oxidoreductase subunit A [Pirellulales bacterium]
MMPIFLFLLCAAALCVGLLVVANLLGPRRPGPVKRMPYESGMDPVHEARRRFNIRFYLLAIAFLVFDVELLFLYPWAVANGAAHASQADPAAVSAPQGLDAAVAEGLVESRGLIFAGVMVFFILLTLGLVYDWRKGIFRWR